MVSDTSIRLPLVTSVPPDGYVRPSSPRPLRSAVYQLAIYFRRELHFDFTQFDVDEKSGYCAYVFTRRIVRPRSGEDAYEVYGAVCFREREIGAAHPSHWALQWVWLHPYFRDDGELAKVWAKFLTDFGPGFFPESPYSRAMISFLRKHASDAQRKIFVSLGWDEWFPPQPSD